MKFLLYHFKGPYEAKYQVYLIQWVVVEILCSIRHSPTERKRVRRIWMKREGERKGEEEREREKMSKKSNIRDS